MISSVTFISANCHLHIFISLIHNYIGITFLVRNLLESWHVEKNEEVKYSLLKNEKVIMEDEELDLGVCRRKSRRGNMERNR